jgi:hypothetical protein
MLHNNTRKINGVETVFYRQGGSIFLGSEQSAIINQQLSINNGQSAIINIQSSIMNESYLITQ